MSYGKSVAPEKKHFFSWPVIYFLEVVILGHLFLLNLFLAILLQNFEESARETAKQKEEISEKK